MQLIDKANILTDLMSRMYDHEPWYPFLNTYESAILLARSLNDGLVLNLTSAGETAIDNAYAALLSFYGVPDLDYADLNELFDYGILNGTMNEHL